jgi:hypothetical protein
VKSRKAVKRRPNLRQVWREKRKSCQKKAQLKTGLACEEEKLSKERSTYDRFGVKREKAVKRKLNLRQV